MKNNKHIKEIYEILQQQAEINRMHGNAIAELENQNKDLIIVLKRFSDKIDRLETVEPHDHQTD